LPGKIGLVLSLACRKAFISSWLWGQLQERFLQFFDFTLFDLARSGVATFTARQKSVGG
jgi:hypothetical protein